MNFLNISGTPLRESRCAAFMALPIFVLSLTGSSAFAATLASGSISTIVNANAGLCLGVKGGSAANGALLQSQNCSGSSFQQWKIVKDSSGYFQVINMGSGKCMDVTGGSTTNGTNMQQWGCSGADNQKWNISDQGNGQFAFISKYSGLALDVYESSVANGARIVQWGWWAGTNQKWSLPNATVSNGTAGPGSGAIITLTGVHAGNCIGVKGSTVTNGAVLQSQGCSTSSFQQWKALKDSSGHYALVNVGSGKCMDVPGASDAGGLAIQQWDCSSADKQKWIFNNDGAGHYYVTSKSSGLALDVLNSSTTNGAAIIQWNYWGGANQQWIAKSVGPTSSGTSNAVSGFAAQKGADGLSTTTGGAGGAVTTVTTCSALSSALASSTARIIHIPNNATIDCRTSSRTLTACLLSCPDYQDAGKKFYRVPVGTQTCKDLGASTAATSNTTANDIKLSVKSNKTLVGLGKNSKIVGATLNLGGASNIIIRNLMLENINPHLVEGGDGITLDNSSHIWIDHVKFRMISDGHVDIKNSENVTLSWNRFDGYNTYVCGNQHHYTMAVQDSNVTLHHNFYDRTSGRNPKLDGAYTRAHLYNNYWFNITYFSIGAGGGAQALIEHNSFANSARPHWNNGGYMSAKGNVYLGASATDAERDSGHTVFTDVSMYPYALDAASGLSTSLPSLTGPQ